MAIWNRQEIIDHLKTDYTNYFTTCTTDTTDAICGTELNTALTDANALIAVAAGADVGVLVIDFIDNGIDTNGDGTPDAHVINPDPTNNALIAEGLKQFYSVMLLRLYTPTQLGENDQPALINLYGTIYNDMFDLMSDAMTTELP